jgi:hypothetical protein
MNNSHNALSDVIKINKKCFLYAETYYMLRFVQIRNNCYENRLIFLLLANANIVLQCPEFVFIKNKIKKGLYYGAKLF